jgi:hypothetical protein
MKLIEVLTTTTAKSGIFFYQSTEAINTLVDKKNPAHVKLYDELLKKPRNYSKVTDLMKKAGLKAGHATDFTPHTR